MGGESVKEWGLPLFSPAIDLSFKDAHLFRVGLLTFHNFSERSCIEPKLSLLIANRERILKVPIPDDISSITRTVPYILPFSTSAKVG